MADSANADQSLANDMQVDLGGNDAPPLPVESERKTTESMDSDDLHRHNEGPEGPAEKEPGVDVAPEASTLGDAEPGRHEQPDGHESGGSAEDGVCRQGDAGCEEAPAEDETAEQAGGKKKRKLLAHEDNPEKFSEKRRRHEERKAEARAVKEQKQKEREERARKEAEEVEQKRKEKEERKRRNREAELLALKAKDARRKRFDEGLAGHLREVAGVDPSKFLTLASSQNQVSPETVEVHYTIDLVALADALSKHLSSRVGEVQDVLLPNPEMHVSQSKVHFRVVFQTKENAQRAQDLGALELPSALVAPKLSSFPSWTSLLGGAALSAPNTCAAAAPSGTQGAGAGAVDAPALHKSLEATQETTSGTDDVIQGDSVLGKDRGAPAEMASCQQLPAQAPTEEAPPKAGGKQNWKRSKAAMWCHTETPLPPALTRLGGPAVVEAAKLQLSQKVGPIAAAQFFFKKRLGIKLTSEAAVDAVLNGVFTVTVNGVEYALPRFLRGLVSPESKPAAQSDVHTNNGGSEAATVPT